MRRKSNSATIYDVAKLAQVSASTVSRAFSQNRHTVLPETRERIFAAAKALSYQCKKYGSDGHEHAQNVYVLLPNLQNPYYTSFLSGLEYSLRSYKINITLVITNNDLEQEKEALANIPKEAKALIIVPVSKELDHIEDLIAKGLDVVLIEASLPEKCSSIQFNSFAGGKIATQYLIDLEKKRIAYLSPALSRKTRIDVYEGFLSALHENGIEVDSSLIYIDENLKVDQDYSWKIGADMCQQLLQNTEQLPDAILCESDIIAIGAMWYLTSRKIEIPKDISIMGIDNIPFCTLVHPELTTVDQCTREMGLLAAELIHGRLTDPTRKHVNLLLEPQLVIRQSVI